MFGIFAGLRSRQTGDGHSVGQTPDGRANAIETTDVEAVDDVVVRIEGISDEVSDISDEMAAQLSRFDLGDGDVRGEQKNAWADGGFEFGYSGTPSSKRGR